MGGQRGSTREAGRHGRHAGPGRRTPSGRRRIAYAGGIAATLVAWGLLVEVAIEFGSDARTGDTIAWLFLALATIGAIACLLLAMVLGQALLAGLRTDHPALGRRTDAGDDAVTPAPGGHRAHR